MTLISPVAAATPGSGPTAASGRRSTRRPSLLRRLARRPLGLAALVVLVVIVVACALAPVIAPYAPEASSFTAELAGPSARHLLGTDELGRDILSRLLYGGRPTLLAAAEAAAIAIAIGTILGVVAGYRRGVIDRLLSLWADLLLAMPVLVVLIVFISVFPSTPYPTMIPLGLLLSAAPMRVVRSVTVAVREDLYIDAARVSGLGHRQIIIRHVLPRIRGPIVVQATLVASVAVMLATGLAFLGFGVVVPAPSWGSMVAEAASQYQQQPWMLVPTGGIIALTVLSLGLLGDAIRDVTAEQWAGGSSRTRPRRRRGSASNPIVPDLGRTDHLLVTGDRGVPVLSVNALTVTAAHEGQPLVLVEGVNFDLHPGRTLAIVGESGCGKSVTARALVGVVPDGGASVGSVRLGDLELLGAGRDVLRSVRGRRVAFIGQEPLGGLDPTQTVGRALREVVRIHTGAGRAEADRQVLELLRQVRIPDPGRVAGLYPHQISGGMAQRVTIARALAGRPEVLIADEPTTALDVTVQAEVLALLAALQRETGVAVLLITHDWGVVAGMADDVLVMYAGQPVESGSADAVFNRPRHPYTDSLLRSDPHRARAGAELPSIPGAVPAPGQWPHGCRFADRCALSTAACTTEAIPMREAETDEVGHAARCVHSERLAAVRAMTAGIARTDER